MTEIYENTDIVPFKTSSTDPTHLKILLESCSHYHFSSILRPKISTFIPSCDNLYRMAEVMMTLVSENVYLAQRCPSFTSIGFYCYVGYLYFYQILRAKDKVNHCQLNAQERKVLRTLEEIGDPKDWSVPTPLIGIIQALGYCKSPNMMFSYIVPAIPDLSHVSCQPGTESGIGFENFHNVQSILRIPPIPAYIEFLRLFGNNSASYDKYQGWIPTQKPILNENNTFMGMDNSTVDAREAFKAFSLSFGWKSPCEADMSVGSIQAQTKRQAIKRWCLPTLSEVNINGLEAFTGLGDSYDSSWIKRLLEMAEILCDFFPGSQSLADIEPVSHIGHLVQCNIDCNPSLREKDNFWYAERSNTSISFYGYDDTENGRYLSNLGLAAGVNYSYENGIVYSGNASAVRSGPFFEDDSERPNIERRERFAFEGFSNIEPSSRFADYIHNLYDASGKK